MVAELALTAGNPTTITPKPGLVTLHPAGSVGTVVLDWGDGSTPDTLSFDGSGPVTVSHQYAARGVYVPILLASSGNQTIQPPVVVR